jgi:hypothetical protein
LLVLTIPFGIALFRLAGFAAWPFGRTTVPAPGVGAVSALGNVVWFLLIGWWLALLQRGRGRVLPDDHRDSVRHRVVQARPGGSVPARKARGPHGRAGSVARAGIVGLPDAGGLTLLVDLHLPGMDGVEQRFPAR